MNKNYMLLLFIILLIGSKNYSIPAYPENNLGKACIGIALAISTWVTVSKGWGWWQLKQELSKNPRALLEASYAGDREKVLKLMSVGANLNYHDERRYTALSEACRNEQLSVARLLIENGADINDNACDMPPLYSACTHYRTDIALLLITMGADVNGQDNKGSTPLHCACSNENLKVVEALIEAGANVNTAIDLPYRQADYEDIDGSCPLHFATGNAQILKLLLENGASTNAKTILGTTALHIAALRGQADAVKLLIHYGANVNERIENGMFYMADNTPFRFGYDCLSPEKPGRITPLHCAVANEHTEIAHKLIFEGADVNAIEYYDGCPLHWAINRNNSALVLLLIENGAHVDVKNKFGNTPLHSVALKSQTPHVNRFLSQFTTVLKEIKASWFNSQHEQKVWDLKKLALCEILNNVEDYEDSLQIQIDAMKAIEQITLTHLEIFFPFLLDLKKEKIRALLNLSKEIQEPLITFCKQEHLKWVRKMIEIKNNRGKTPLDFAIPLGAPIMHLLERAYNAKCFGELPDKIRNLALSNIMVALGLEPIE